MTDKPTGSCFCGDCGSPIYSQREQTPEIMAVRAGTFDNAGEIAGPWASSNQCAAPAL